MQITKAQTHPYSLPLRQVWRSAAGLLTERCGWLVELTTADGYTGWGDCAPLPEAGTETLAVAKAVAEQFLPKLPVQADIPIVPHFTTEIECLLSSLLRHYPPALRCGVETALLDLAAQYAGVPLARWLNKEAKLSVLVNAAIGTIGSELIKRALAAVDNGYKILKIKVGLQDWDVEQLYLYDLACALPAGIQLRLDANQAWSESIATIALDSLTDFPIESVEEPLAGANFKILAKLQEHRPFALALDESLANTPTKMVLDNCPVRRLVLKPTVLGGLTRALTISKRAHQLGIEVVITSTLESSVGIRAAAHVAAAIGGNIAHGLATSDWFKYNLTYPPIIKQDYLLLDNHQGLDIKCFLDRGRTIQQ